MKREKIKSVIIFSKGRVAKNKLVRFVLCRYLDFLGFAEETQIRYLLTDPLVAF
jgi:hypothetical protein